MREIVVNLWQVGLCISFLLMSLKLTEVLHVDWTIVFASFWILSFVSAIVFIRYTMKKEVQ